MKVWVTKRADSEDDKVALQADQWEPFGIETVLVRGTTRSVYMWFKKEIELPDGMEPLVATPGEKVNKEGDQGSGI